MSDSLFIINSIKPVCETFFVGIRILKALNSEWDEKVFATFYSGTKVVQYHCLQGTPASHKEIAGKSTLS